MTAARVKSWALGAGSALLLTFLFIQQRPIDPRQNNRFTHNLLRIKQLDAEVNRDLLSSRFELLSSYDPFVQKMEEMRKAAANLRPIPSFIGGSQRDTIESFLKRDSELLSGKARLLETFKSDNAILKNSSRYLPLLIAETSREAKIVRDAELRDHLGQLLRDVLLFHSSPSAELTIAVNREIDLLSDDLSRKPKLKDPFGSVIAHAANIVNVQPRVQSVTEALHALPIARNLDDLSSAYSREYDRSMKNNSVYRIFLYVCSVILLGYAAEKTITLVKSRLVLEQSNHRLHDANGELLQTKRELQSRNLVIESTVEQLRNAQERYELAVRGANDGLWDWDLITGEMYLSPRCKAMLGFGPEELANVPDSWIKRIHPEDRDRVLQEWADHLEDRSQVFESEHRMLHDDGTYRWVLSRGMAVRGPDSRALRVAGSLTDITGNKSKDPLTGLANRLLFTERLSQVMRETRRGRTADYAVLFLDVDRFKVVNDSLGHVAGDSLLRQIADRLRGCVRATDTVCRLFGNTTVARLGGDEFAILIERDSTPEIARSIANRVVAEFGLPFQVEGRDIVSTFSVGVAVGNDDYASPEEIIRDADLAMYEAKVSGKRRAGFFDPAMRWRAVNRLETEADIRTGIERGEFAVFYQPKVDLASGEIIGFEALVRWIHPIRGMVFPSDFIPVAEETGLIVPLGYWVLSQACSQLREWQHCGTNPNLSVSVNISCAQFAEPDLVDQVVAIVRESGITPGSLDLELTESAVMKDPDAASKTLKQFKAFGIGLHMDDFGTGYSSLSYLQRFPFDAIKIDRSFVSGLGSRVENRDLIRTIVALAKNFGLQIVAEGIETELQSSELKALGCNHGQGYLISKPVAASIAGEMILGRQGSGLEEIDELCLA